MIHKYREHKQDIFSQSNQFLWILHYTHTIFNCYKNHWHILDHILGLNKLDLSNLHHKRNIIPITNGSLRNINQTSFYSLFINPIL